MIGPESTATPTPTVTDLIEIFNHLDPKLLLKGIKKSAKNHSGKVEMLTREGKLAFRPSPEALSKFINEMDELSEISESNPREFAKRASTSFVTKLRDGDVIIEKKALGKRAAFGNKKATDSIRNGSWKLTNNKSGKQAKEVKYDSVTVVEHKDFESIANSFLLRFSMAGNTTTSNVTSEAITSKADDLIQHTMHTNIAEKVVIRTPEKASDTSEKKKTTDELPKEPVAKNVLEQEEHNLKVEKANEQKQQKVEAKVLRDKELNQSIEQTQETTKQAVLKADNKEIAAKIAEETAPSPSEDVAPSPLAPPS